MRARTIRRCTCALDTGVTPVTVAIVTLLRLLRSYIGETTAAKRMTATLSVDTKRRQLDSEPLQPPMHLHPRFAHGSRYFGDISLRLR